MDKWVRSWRIYEKFQKEYKHEPLSVAEKQTLDSMTYEDWQKLANSTDTESQVRLTVSQIYSFYPFKNVRV